MSDHLFYKFVGEMSEILDKSVHGYDDQKKLLKQLFSIEKEFKEILTSSAKGKEIYKDFMRFILNEEGNILSARVYFRERQNTFSNKIAKAFHQNKPEKLHKFKINFTFAAWVMKRNNIKNKKLKKLFEEMKALRNELCEMNLPLAINRSKIFWSKTPECHLEYMDLIQASSEGLLIAIDKFVPPFKQVFRSVAIGRMVAYMIEDNSETVVKLSPTEKRILYLANKAKNSEKLDNEKDILEYINQTFPNVTQDYLTRLKEASSVVDIEQVGVNTENNGPSFNNKNAKQKAAERFFKSEKNMEENLINEDLKKKILFASKDLSIFEKKVLSLTYGVNLLKK